MSLRPPTPQRAPLGCSGPETPRRCPVRRRRLERSIPLVALLVACGTSPSGSDDTSPAPSATPATPTPSQATPSTPTPPPPTASPTPPPTVAPTPTAAPTPLPAYSAQLRYTEGGVPHIQGDTLADMSFGHGYAFASAHVCILADQVLKVRSERSKYLGPGDDNHNLDFDFGMLALGVYATAERSFSRQPDEVQQLVAGFAAGYNRYLRETAPRDYPGYCAGADWVKPITPVDLFAHYTALALIASGQAVLPGVSRAQPPGRQLQGSPPVKSASLALKGTGIGSNGWALGKDKTASGHGMLAANPHFPWEGELRFFEVHLTVPGQLDVYGGALMGSAMVNIGFNPDVAWTHTFSWASRGTFYRLQLDPTNPTRYRYDNKFRDMEATEWTIQVKQPSGRLEPLSRTLYRTHWGPIISTEELGWTPLTALTFRDVNDNNTSLFEQFTFMAMAKSMEEFQGVHRSVHGIPWVHTMSVDSAGAAIYIDSSRVPRLSSETLSRWQANLEGGDPLTVVAWELGAPLLDGTTSDDEWVENRYGDATVPIDEAPYLERDDFVFNSNDSHWLANPASPLEGYNPLYGPERTPRSPRSRMNMRARTSTSTSGEDGRFDLEELTQTLLNNRPMLSELLLAEALERCAATPLVVYQGAQVDVSPACEALASWDGRLDLQSRGALVWREMMSTFTEAEREDGGRLFANAFDPDDPIHTPWGLYSPQTPIEPDPTLQAMAFAMGSLAQAGFALDAPLGDAQYTLKGELRVPVHGGSAQEGPTNMVYMDTSPITNTSLEPPLTPGTLVNAESGLSDQGYLVNYGSSLILAVAYTDSGPRGKVVLTYSQTSDEDSPNFTDQSFMFAEKAWRDVRFSDADIEASPELVRVSVDNR